MKLIACVDMNWAIGNEGNLLFHIHEDLKRFKELTYGHTIVYGSKTLKTFPNGKPLKNRLNIMLSTKNNDSIDVVTINSLEELHSLLQGINDTVFVIGGASVYKQLLPLCAEAYITMVMTKVQNADAYCPNLDEDTDWMCVEDTIEDNGIYTYKFCKYIRVREAEYDYKATCRPIN